MNVVPQSDSEAGAVRVWNRRDAGIAVLLGVLATLGGVGAVRAYVGAGNPPFYYQGEFAPAVMSACGRGFQNPPDAAQVPGLADLGAFLAESSPSFDCATLPPVIVSRPLNAFQLVHRNLMELAGWVWRLNGVSWTSLEWLSGAFMGVSVALAYLFLRAAMGTPLAVLLAILWATSPLHLSQLPHLRDYAKTPFFMFVLCAVIWAARYRARPAITVITMAAFGVVLGLGFGIRTDVASYLPFIIVALILFRPQWTVSDLATRVAASVAAVAMFLLVAAPVLRGYQSGNNLAHVAILGLTDPSRDWLHLQPALYSYGYLYDDGYVAAMIEAEAERKEVRQVPVTLGSAAYAFWSNELYGKLLRTFPADLLTRSWSAVRAALNLPFMPMQAQAPAWTSGPTAKWFEWRGAFMAGLGIIPPVAVTVVAVVMLGAVSLRLGLLAAGLCALLAGTTAVQFQGRHIFQLEVLPLFALGFLVSTGWRRLCRRPGPALNLAVLRRAVVLAVVLLVVIVAPIRAARRYQTAQVESLLTLYETVATAPLGTTVVPADDGNKVMVVVSDTSPHYSERFIDNNFLALEFGGDHCDADVVGLTFRYRVKAPYPDLSRSLQVPMPPPGPLRTRVLFPTFSTGARMTDPEAMTFTGLELATAQYACLAGVSRVVNTAALPILMEAVLAPGWRDGALYEAFQDLEPRTRDWAYGNYAIPDGLQPGRSWLARIETPSGTPTFQSSQVTRLDAARIEAHGRAGQAGAYLVSWAYQQRPAGSAFFVEGELVSGGITVGLQRDERWSHQLNVDRPGRFRVVIRIDADGLYGPILANHQNTGSHRSVITRYGWLPPTP